MFVPQTVELISEAEPRCGAVTVQFRYLKTRGVSKEKVGKDKEKGGAGYDAGTRFMERYFSENTSVARTLAAGTL